MQAGTDAPSFLAAPVASESGAETLPLSTRGEQAKAERSSCGQNALGSAAWANVQESSAGRAGFCWQPRWGRCVFHFLEFNRVLGRASGVAGNLVLRPSKPSPRPVLPPTSCPFRHIVLRSKSIPCHLERLASLVDCTSRHFVIKKKNPVYNRGALRKDGFSRPLPRESLSSWPGRGRMARAEVLSAT